MVRSSATRALKAALRSYGNQGQDRQRNRGFFSGMIRGVSNAREGSKILTFFYWPRRVCSSLLHLRSSWKVNSRNVALCAFSEVRCYSITSRMPSLIRFISCAPTSPTIISGEVGSADDRAIPTQSSANLFDFSAPARCSKMLIEVSVPSPLSSA